MAPPSHPLFDEPLDQRPKAADAAPVSAPEAAAHLQRWQKAKTEYAPLVDDLKKAFADHGIAFPNVSVDVGPNGSEGPRIDLGSGTIASALALLDVLREAKR